MQTCARLIGVGAPPRALSLSLCSRSLFSRSLSLSLALRKCLFRDDAVQGRSPKAEGPENLLDGSVAT
eukprot:1196959-Prymnesium_polylepis.1